MLENYMCSVSCCIAVCYLSLFLVLNLIVRTAIKKKLTDLKVKPFRIMENIMQYLVLKAWLSRLPRSLHI